MTSLFLDTNASVDFLSGGLSASALAMFGEAEHVVSVITQIELLSYRPLDTADEQLLQRYVSRLRVIPLTEDVVLRSAEVRRNYRLRLPDAVIAATALILSVPLYSNNTKDFARVPGLILIDQRKM